MVDSESKSIYGSTGGVTVGQKSPNSPIAILCRRRQTHVELKCDRSLNQTRISPAEFGGEYGAHVRREM